ncbi:MAG: tetratricopeptide repeat protein [Planctomycetota bacterium]
MEPDPKDVRIAREAQGYLELELWPEALERANALLERETLVPAALAVKGEVYRNQERWDDGAEIFARLTEVEPGAVHAWVMLGWCRKRGGRLDLALEAMEGLLEHRPEEGIGLYNLACYCSLDGQRERALVLLDQAIDREREFREHARTESDLDPIRSDPEFRRIVGE